MPLETNVSIVSRSHSIQATFLRGPGIAQFSNPIVHVVGVASRLPDELLDKIFREVYELRLWHSMPLKGPCHSCSLVCRRWRTVCLPYLFRHIRIPLQVRDPRRGLRDYIQFTLSNQVLGGLVRSVGIHRLLAVDIVELDALLANLPQLQSLRLDGCTFVNSGGVDGIDRRIYRDHFVEDFHLELEDITLSIFWYQDILDILSLFSKISTLWISLDKPDEMPIAFTQEDSPVLDSMAETSAIVAPTWQSNISRFTMTGCPPPMVSFLRRFLCNVGALRGLRELGLELIDPEQMLPQLDELFTHIGPSLSILRLEVPRENVDYWIEEPSGPHHCAGPISYLYSSPLISLDSGARSLQYA